MAEHAGVTVGIQEFQPSINGEDWSGLCITAGSARLYRGHVPGLRRG